MVVAISVTDANERDKLNNLLRKMKVKTGEKYSKFLINLLEEGLNNENN